MALDLAALWAHTRMLGPALGMALGAVAVWALEMAARAGRPGPAWCARIGGALLVAGAVVTAVGAVAREAALRAGLSGWMGEAAAAVLAAGVAVGSGRRGALQVPAFVVVIAALAGLMFDGPAGSCFAGAAMVDGLGRFLGMVVLLAAGVTILMAPGYLAARQVEEGEFHGLLLLAASGALLVCQATELVTLFLAVEIMSVATYVLVGITRQEGRSVEAAMKYFVAGAFASAFLLYGMALVYGGTGTTSLGAGVAAGGEPWVQGGLLLMLVGVLFKIGAAPFHPWVPDAYEGAAVPVTCFMSVGVKAAGFAALVRVLGAWPQVAQQGEWAGLLGLAAAATILVGNLMAVVQESVKRMLAYSSVAHTGYALAAVVAMVRGGGTVEAGAEGLGAAAFYMVAYGFMTLGAFAFLALAPRDGRERETYGEFDGLGRVRPWAALGMTVLLLSLAGMPPTAGFFAKFLVLKALVGQGLVLLAAVVVVGTMVSFYYYVRVVVHMYMRPEGALPAREVDGNVGWAVALCTFFTVWTGVWPALYLDRALVSAASFLGF